MPVDFGTYAEIAVSLINSSGTIATSANSDVTFSSPIPQPTTFILDNSYWNNFPPPSGVSVKPILEFDGVDQLPSADIAFGVDIQLQDGSISEDYDILAYSQILSNAGSGDPQIDQFNAEQIALNPFSYFVDNNQVNAKIKGDLFSINPTKSMFKFDSNYNLEENPLITEDTFFTRVGNDIILKNL